MNARFLTGRLAGLGVALLLGGGATVAVSPAANAAASCTTSGTITTCIDVTSTDTAYDFVTHYSTKFVNTKSGTVTATCDVNTSKTTSATISSSVTVGADALFAKADATVSGALERSVTSSAGTSVSFSVPAGATRTCTYGTSRSKVSGTVKKVNCSSQGCITTASGTWYVIGPRQLTWKIS